MDVRISLALGIAATVVFDAYLSLRLVLPAVSADPISTSDSTVSPYQIEPTAETSATIRNGSANSSADAAATAADAEDDDDCAAPSSSIP
ncbi:hypothetical protein THAOC_33382, partial [Thalassiosira oceanica]